MADPYRAVGHGQLIRHSQLSYDDGTNWRNLLSSWLATTAQYATGMQLLNKILGGDKTAKIPDPIVAPGGKTITIKSLQVWCSLAYSIKKFEADGFVLLDVDDGLHYLRWRMQIDTGSGFQTVVDISLPDSGLLVHANTPSLPGIGLLPAKSANATSFFRSLIVPLTDPIVLAPGHRLRLQGQAQKEATILEYDCHMAGTIG